MRLTEEVWYNCITHKITVNVIYSGVATGGGQGGTVPPLTAKNLPKIGKNQEKKRKNREEKAKIGKVLSLYPSWQTGLATLLVIKQWLPNLSLNL